MEIALIEFKFDNRVDFEFKHRIRSIEGNHVFIPFLKEVETEVYT